MALSTAARVFASSSFFEGRSDPDFSAAPKLEKLGQNRSTFTGRFNAASALTGGTAAFYGFASPLILRFPPNFQRQLSTKARRNCSNIGVAQIVAASWSNNNNQAAGVPASASAASSAVDAGAATAPLSVAPVEVTGDNDVVVVSESCDRDGAVQFQDSVRSSYSSFLKNDGSVAIHAGS